MPDDVPRRAGNSSRRLDLRRAHIGISDGTSTLQAQSRPAECRLLFDELGMQMAAGMQFPQDTDDVVCGDFQLVQCGNEIGQLLR